MSTFIRFSVLSAVLLLLVSIPAGAQTNLENALKQYNAETVQGYIQPLADLFGANVQAGLFRSAAIPTSGFHMGFRLIGMGALLSDDAKSYNAPTPAGWTPATFATATVFGGKGTTVKLQTDTTLKYKGSDGVLNTTMFPLAVPELIFGSVAGTEVSVRFIPIPALEEEKFPSGTLWGLGVRHSLSQYMTKPPLDIALGGFFNSFKLGDIIDFKGYSVNAQGSKLFSKLLLLYGGVAYENTAMTLKYTTTDPSVDPAVDVKLTGVNNFRFTVGAGLILGIFGIYADANFGSITNFTVSLGLGG